MTKLRLPVTVFTCARRPRDLFTVEDLLEFLKEFNLSLPPWGRVRPRDYTQLIRKVRERPDAALLESVLLRSQSLAVYTPENNGHFGLALDAYAHFTSPIRRYPDMMVHRLLNAYEHGAATANREEYEIKCRHSSEMERLAQEAERESIKYKQVEFMADKIGQEFDGLISGVSKWGIYVEIKENKVEGMVRLSDMADDYYFLDEENYQVIGHNKRKKYKLGSPVKIKIKRADFLKKELDFEVVSS